MQQALRYGICGPTLSDLKDNLGVSTEDVSNSVSLMCVGICVGAICSKFNIAPYTYPANERIYAGGFVCKFFSREFLCFVLVLTTAILVASITFLTQFSLFLVWNLLVGITSGASISICESWILQIWGSQCGPYMQALQFFRGLGYIIAPVLANPFLVSNGGIGLKEEELPNATLATLSEWYNQTNTPIHSTSYNTKIRTPYLLNAIMLAVGAIFLLCLYIYKRFSLSKDKPSKAISQIEILSNSALSLADSKCVQSVVLADKKGDGQSVVMNRRAKYFGYAIVLLSSVFYLFFYEEVIVIFLPTFASKLNLRLSKSEASMLTTAFSLCNVIGKAVGVLLALKISYMLILYLNLFIMIGSLVVIILFANTSVTVLWIGVCLHGEFFVRARDDASGPKVIISDI